MSSRSADQERQRKWDKKRERRRLHTDKYADRAKAKADKTNEEARRG